MGMYLIISKLDAAMHLHFIDTVTALGILFKYSMRKLVSIVA